MTLDRRDFLKAAAGTGALFLAHPSISRAGVLLGSPVASAPRASKLAGSQSTFLVHGDLHNHSLYSDGSGTPEQFFASMRSNNLDVAAITDHTTVSKGLPVSACGGDTPCSALGGLNDLTWDAWRTLADAANEDGVFTAIRGFEWSSPFQGHINVWFSQQYGDPLHDAGGFTGEGAAAWGNAEGGFPPTSYAASYEEFMRQSPTNGSTMALFYEWLSADPNRPVRNGGSDAICGFNHPGREPGRFGYFDSRMRDLLGLQERIVSIEMFNRNEDYLFEGTTNGAPSPLVDCLDKGWRVGILGVTDEHGTVWGNPARKGRTGLWVIENTRDGVKEAMLARRFFATNHPGLRLDATLNGVRMGQEVSGIGSSATIEFDIDKGSSWVGRTLNAQVLASGYPMPQVLESFTFAVPGPSDPPISFSTNVDSDDKWLVLRISDPAESGDSRGSALWKSYGRGIAYASPFFIKR